MQSYFLTFVAALGSGLLISQGLSHQNKIVLDLWDCGAGRVAKHWELKMEGEPLATWWIGVLDTGFVAIASGLLSWFVMQSRMEVKLAEQRETLAELRGQIKAEKESMELSVASAAKIAEEMAKREAFDRFLGELKVEKRHYTRENRMLMNSRKSLVLQERMYFRNIPLSDWIEHEIMIDEGADVNRLVQDMTVFDKGVVSIDEVPRRKQLA